MNSAFISLVVFVALCILGFLAFRKNKGWFWTIQKRRKKGDKIWIEDILKLLYHSTKNNQSVSLSNLSAALKLKESRAIELLNQMEVDGLVKATAASVEIKEKGVTYALKIIRVHRLWEKYLSERTGFDKLEWHEMAEVMEHKLSESEIEELAVSLGNPRFDPHGDPIPTDSGEIRLKESSPLSSLTVGEMGKIVHIEDEPKVIYRQIIDADIHVGSVFQLLEKTDSEIVFKSEGETHSFNSLVASNIAVSTLSEADKEDSSITRLSRLNPGEEASIIRISGECRGDLRRRLLDLGFVKGSKISISNTSPLGNPVSYQVRGTSIALRKKNCLTDSD